MVPEATTAVGNFFQWVNTMIGGFMDFINWFFYVSGINPGTWALIMSIVMTLLLVWIFQFPFKLVMSVFRGMRS
jgi:hypothetical protein